MPQRLAWPSYPPDFKDSSHIELFELFEAYASCRHNKRRTINALAFEVDYEQQLIHLCDEINTGRYQPSYSQLAL